MKQEATLTAQQRKRLDRQRFIGLQTQKKLLSLRVLITPANGPNTQLAKNLVLAGVNVTIYDNAIANHNDFQTNFLIAQKDIGKARGQAVYDKIKQMNPHGKNQFFQENINQNMGKYGEDFFKKYGIIATSFTSFSDMAKWDSLSKKFNIPYYNLVNAGLHAFVYISLGNKFTYKQVNTIKQIQTNWSVDILPFQKCFNSGQLKNPRQFGTLAAVMMMEKAEKEGLKYDPFDQINPQNNKTNFQKILSLGSQIRNNAKQKQMMQDFARCYGIDYCPVYSVIGSIISQEIIKVVQNKFQPAMNWLVYNSDEGYSNVIKLQQQAKLFSSTQNNLNV